MARAPQVVSRYPTGNWEWQDWVDNSAPAEDGLTQYDFSTATSDGVFRVRAAISDGIVGNLNPNAMKLDFGLESFPYAGTGTSLCFVGKIMAHIKIKPEDEGERKAKGTVKLDLNSEEVAGLWSWVDTVTADGDELPVVATLVADGGDGKKQVTSHAFASVNRLSEPPCRGQADCAGVARPDRHFVLVHSVHHTNLRKSLWRRMHITRSAAPTD